MADNFQYVKMPDGSYGKFAADATPDQMRSAVQQHFPDAYKQQPAAPQDDRSAVSKFLVPDAEQEHGYGEMLKGAAKGVAGDVGDLGSLVNKIPVLGKVIAPQDEVNYYQDKSHANNGYQMAGKGIESAAEILAPGIEALPSAEHAGQVLGRVADAAKDVRVPLSSTAAPLQRYAELSTRGGAPAKAATDLLTRSQAPIDMTFPEARDYYSNISNLSADEAGKLNSKMKSAVGAVRKGFHGDLVNAANQVGMGGEYADALKEYRRHAQLTDIGGKALKYAVPGAGVLGAIEYAKDKVLGH